MSDRNPLSAAADPGGENADAVSLVQACLNMSYKLEMYDLAVTVETATRTLILSSRENPVTAERREMSKIRPRKST